MKFLTRYWIATLTLSCAHSAVIAQTHILFENEYTDLVQEQNHNTKSFNVKVGSLLARFNLRISKAYIGEKTSLNINGFDLHVGPSDIFADALMIRATGSIGHYESGFVYCSVTPLPVGPFLVGAAKPFEALTCLFDADGDNRFEAVSFVNFSGREIGPVYINPLKYIRKTGELRKDYVDFIVKRIETDRIFVKSLLFSDGKQVKYFDLRAIHDDGSLTDYEYGCSFNFPSVGADPSQLLDSDIIINGIDKDLQSASVKIEHKSSTRAYVNYFASVFDYIPRKLDRCGDKAAKRY